MLGDEAFARLNALSPSPVIDPQLVARACVALTSGLLDGMTGQVLVVDEGWSLVDPSQSSPDARRSRRRSRDRRPRAGPAASRGRCGRAFRSPATASSWTARRIEALLPHRGLALLLDRCFISMCPAPSIVADYDLASRGPVLEATSRESRLAGTSQVEAIGQAGLLAAVRARRPPIGRPHGRAGGPLRRPIRAPGPRADRRAGAGRRPVRGRGRPVYFRGPRLLRGRLRGLASGMPAEGGP